MSAPPRRPTRSALLTRRGIAAGSLLGAGLLIAGTAAAPLALADDTPASGTTSADTPDAPATTAAPLSEAPSDSTPTDEAPQAYFGTGKNLDIQLQPDGPVPADLDLSGVQFALTPTGTDEVAGYCVTDVRGACTVQTAFLLPGMPGMLGGLAVGKAQVAPALTTLALPSGNYEITQVAGSTPVGLESAGGTIGEIDLCPFFSPCGAAPEADVAEHSLFTEQLLGRVVDQRTGAPVPHASFHLTGTVAGPDYPHLPVADPGDGAAEPTGDGSLAAAAATTSADPTDASPTDAPGADTAPVGDATTSEPCTATGGRTSTTYDCATLISDDKGRLLWDDFFLPGTWRLAATDLPAAYGSDLVVEFTGTTAPAGDAWAVDVDLASAGASTPTVTTQPSTTPAPGGGAGGQGSSSAAASSSSVQPRTTGRSAGTAPGPAGAAAVPPAAAAATGQPAAETAPAAAPSSAPPAPLADGSAPVRLKTESSTLQDTGLIAIGILFVAVVFIAVLVVRRRARRG